MEFPNMPRDEWPDLTEEEEAQVDEVMDDVEYMKAHFTES